jgi:hypothetical protein
MTDQKNETTRVITPRIPASLHAQLTEEAAARKTSMNKLAIEKLSVPDGRFTIASDNSGHDYFIPVDRQEDWDAWMIIPDGDPGCDEVPDWATRIDGTFTFTDPK